MLNLLLIAFSFTIASAISDPDRYTYDPDVIKARKTDYPIHPLIQSRTSPKEMTSLDITDDELFPLFEAARWAPSASNIQPWRFVYAKRNTTNFKTFLDVLEVGNQVWCKNASVLVALISEKFEVYKNKTYPVGFHTFDAGAACMALALEGVGRGLAVRDLGGLDYDKAYKALNIDITKHTIEVFIAIGKRPPVGKRTPVENPISLRNSQKTFVYNEVFPGDE